MSAAAAIAARALALLDLTDLSDTCNQTHIDQLCRRALTPHGKVAAICIWPQYVQYAAGRLKQSGVKIATVINFPKGGSDIDRALDDTREALRDGADEIDLVMPWQAFLQGVETGPRDMIAAVADATAEAHVLKVILETGALVQPDTIARASRLAIAAGANFIKTSTGKIAVSATPEAAQTMMEAIKASGKPVGFKVAGGVRSVADAGIYLDMADQIMGPHWASPTTFRFGASGLLDALLATLDGKDSGTAEGY